MKHMMQQLMSRCAQWWRQLWPHAPQTMQQTAVKGHAKTTVTHEARPFTPRQEEALQLLQARYELRYNVMTEEAEFRPKHSPASHWRSVDQRTFNTMTVEAIDAKLGMWGRDVDRLLHSHLIESFHPLHEYMAQLPAWDGRDRIANLAARVSHDALWMKGFRVWLRALAALWMGHGDCHSNQLVPLLVSSQQGWHKSSFCRLLVPPELARYYSDQFAPNQNAEQLLARMALINLDEFDRFTTKQLPKLKNLIQVEQLSVRRLYRQEVLALPRTASFIATSNEVELLNDPTGSRRFLCVRVKHDIDCSPIDHAQLFAQLKAEVMAGEALFLTKQEEHELEEHNRKFWRRSPMVEVLWQCFRRPKGREEGVALTASEIFVELQRRYPAALRQQVPATLGRLLRGEGLQPHRTSRGSTYRLVAVEGQGGY